MGAGGGMSGAGGHSNAGLGSSAATRTGSPGGVEHSGPSSYAAGGAAPYQGQQRVGIVVGDKLIDPVTKNVIGTVQGPAGSVSGAYARSQRG